MTRRLLFGPVKRAFAEEYLTASRAAGFLQSFGPDAEGPIGTAGTWADALARCPAGWEPDLVAVWLPAGAIPAAVWDAPVPVLGLAAGWDLRWHAYRQSADRYDVVIADGMAADLFRLSGGPQVRPAVLCGLGQTAIAHPWPAPDVARDIDLLFVGSLHLAVGRERLAWLGRLGAVADEYRVVIRSGVSDAEYRDLLGRAKVVFNYSEQNRCNRRAFEAVAAGAALLQERGNSELATLLRPGEEYAEYGPYDFEEVVARLLADDAGRVAMATAAARKTHGFSFEALLEAALAELEPEWDELRVRAGARPKWHTAARLRTRVSLATITPDPRADSTLLADLEQVYTKAPDGDWVEAKAAVVAAIGADPQTVAGLLRRAAEHDPNNPAVGIALAEVLAALGDSDGLRDVARRIIAGLDGTTGGPWAPPAYPPGLTRVRAEWERAAWAHPEDHASAAVAQQTVARWHLHGLLAAAFDDLADYEAAAAARPDLPSGRAALGCALARAGRLADAAGHLEAAVAADPFDRAAARALAQVLKDLGRADDLTRLTHARRTLHKAAPEAVPVEPWFADARPTGAELASLIVLCCNETAVTRLCLDSVLRHTRRPYELVLVDNGSTDDTPAVLAAVRGQPGPDRVVVIRNETNHGYPAGVNQGLAAARGEYLVLLNNDVVLTAGWLDRLVTCSLHDWPRVGLVGAVTNYAPPPQLVEPGYRDLAGLDAFAAEHARRFAVQAIDAVRLTGFCLLVRREVFDKIGRLDERFGLGFFDDDDLCLRARNAGFRLAIALDCYVHHFGSRTFKSLGVDAGRQLETNLDLYRQKWGAEEAGRYRPYQADEPVRVARAPRPAGARPRVSLTMIVKNEEHHLPDCLASVHNLVDEIVIVDTGSTDRTKEVAASFGARVFDFPWVDDFAAARNEALRHATGDWAFWMDADDRLDPENRERAKALFASLTDDNVGYVMKCRCEGGPTGVGVTTVDHVRLFPLRPNVRWKYRVHEQILPAVKAAGGTARWSDVTVTHVGYADPAVRRRKLDRDLRILNAEYAEQPDDPFTLFNLGSVYHELKDPAAALAPLERSLALSDPRDSIVRKLYALIAQCRRELNQPAEALEACARGRAVYPDDEELLFLESIIRRDRRDFAGAEACLKRLVGGPGEGDHFASVAEGLRGHKARHNLAVLYLDTGRPTDAEAEWTKVVADRPDFLPARAGLAEAAFQSRRWDDLEARLAAVESLGPDGEEVAEAVRGRAKLERGEFASARWALGQAVRKFPHSVQLRSLLSQAALREGAHGPAEEALLSVLELAPDHPEARFNLALLRAQRSLRPGAEVSLTGLYRAACESRPGGGGSLPGLYGLARRCPHVTAVGCDAADVATALLCAQPARLVWYGRARPAEFDLLERLATRTAFEVRPVEAAAGRLDPTDLLVVAVGAGSGQPIPNPRGLARQVRRYVALLDTSESGERAGPAGSAGADELIATGDFRPVTADGTPIGLTVLERTAGSA